GGIATDLRLDGVKAGQFRESQMGTSDPFYSLFSPGLAWDTARERLYIAHADGDAITVVDLAGGTVIAQQEVRPRTSLARRVAAWLMPRVAAKGGPSTDRWAVLSNDGARLFVIGQHAEPTQQPDGRWRETMTPTGLQVIETRDLREVAHLDVPANEMMLSPDGRRLILHTYRDDGRGTVSGGSGTRHQLAVVDPDRLVELDHADVGGALSLHGFSADGRYAYLSDAASGGGTRSRTIVRVFDLERRRFVAERALDGPFADLLTSSNDSAH
ncbi:MAG: YncE family protein, partial [Thermomicrobiales bacterium]